MLSKSTTDQIRKEAQEQFPACLDFDNEHRYAYIAGATAWAVWKEKADGYEKALRWIVGMCSINDPMQLAIRNDATKALESFNQNKVK